MPANKNFNRMLKVDTFMIPTFIGRNKKAG